MPRQFELRITLLSDAGPGTGEGRAGAIDREVPHDNFGLPVLPGRRLKGLLRESVLQGDLGDLTAALAAEERRQLLEAHAAGGV